MFTLYGFKILSTIAERPNNAVYRAFSAKLNRNVILKVLRSPFPTAEQVAAFEDEFELLRENLGEGVPRALELFTVDKMRVLVLEDIGGRSLADWIKTANSSVSEKIALAISITRALAVVQAHGIIHRDIKPDNIVFAEDSGLLQISDFGLAKRAGQIDPAKTLAGSLQYISPEQTGRTQNAIDYRSDYYALGVTFYELFSGRLPLNASDEMGWVHSHIAQVEVPLHELDARVPLPISLIAQKLMKKAPEDRYQSCLGIIRDLEASKSWSQGQSFVPGSQDVSRGFRLSQKLYGREEEAKILNSALNNVRLGGRRLAMVSGDPGVGKSSLINLIRESVKTSGGYFISGKYDQYRKDIPFSALIQAFNQFVAQILTEDEASIRDWKEKILGAMGENAAIVLGILPQMELITGKVPPVEDVPDNEQRQRFQHTFHNFIRACCERGRPLVIFLDDLQWADSASRSLMQMFLTEKEAESLLFVGSYRRNELTQSHPLNQLIRDLQERQLASDEIYLSNLQVKDIAELLRDSFPVSTGDHDEFAKVVFAKTNGNPFFVSQFLRMLYDKKLLRFEVFSGWAWDVQAIVSEDVTSNVLDLLSETIARLPASSQDILQLASCFGSYFKVEELKSYNRKSDSENEVLLQPALEAGLIVHGEKNSYRFVHDRVQEAAHGLMDTETRVNFHHQIAQRLLATWSPEKIHEGIFYLVNHWNAGAALATSPAERERSAELNLLAAERAKNSSVYDLALNYAAMGLELLGSEDWDKHERFLRPLMSVKAPCEFSVGQPERAEKTFQAILERTEDGLQKAQIYTTMTELAHVQKRDADAVRWGLKALSLMKFPKPRTGKLRLLVMMLRIRKLLAAKMRAGEAQTEPQDEFNREVIRIHTAMAAAAYRDNKPLLVYLCVALVGYSLRKGFLATGARAVFCAYLWYVLHDLELAFKSSEFLRKIFDESDTKHLDAEGAFGLFAFTYHVTGTYRESIRQLERANHALTLNGEVIYAANCAYYAAVMVMFTERKYATVAAKVERYRQLCENLNYDFVLGSFDSIEVFTHDIAGTPELAKRTLEETWDFIHAPNSVISSSWFCGFRLIVDILKGNYKKAFDEIRDVEAGAKYAPFTPLTFNARIMEAVARMKNFSRMGALERFKQKRKVRAEIRFFKKLSRVNPANYQCVYLMLAAEWQVACGNHSAAVRDFQAAAETAKKCEIIFIEPLVHTLMAEALLAQGLDKLAEQCLRDAVFSYESLGALGLKSALEERFSKFDLARGAARAQGDSRSTISHAAEMLDLDTVLKATNTLMSEIDMGRLVRKMLESLIENAGAERGVLFLLEDQRLMAKGEARVNVNGVDGAQLLNTPFESFDQIPRAMITYVQRTQEPMVLDNAMEDARLGRDEYVTRHKVLSSVCLPISAQGELRGIVYLENNSAKGVFSPERVELMRTLSGQIAISLENARLYQQQGEAIRMQNELRTAHAVQEMLFPQPEFSAPGVNIAGYYQPATECGGDWWSYSQTGDWVYAYIGDATGHGAPAAFVTSAACSAVSIIQKQADLTPEKAMEHLNAAVYATTKGRITMTFFVGALNRLTGEFRYVRASHEPPLLLRKSRLDSGEKLRKALEPMMGQNGLALGETPGHHYVGESVMLNPGDTVILYTDGLPELLNKNGEAFGERRFWQGVHNGCKESNRPQEAVAKIISGVQAFRGEHELHDDITLCVLQYTGEASGLQRESAA